MEINLQLQQLFQQIGVPVSAFDPQFAAVQGDGGASELDRTEFGTYGSQYYAWSTANGREYFLPVTVTYQDSNGQNVDWDLPFPVVSVQAKKTIIETPLTERRGTVKEYIQIEDYNIRIRGFIINTANEFPESDVITLRTLFEQNVPVSIKCPLTDIFLLRPTRSGSDQVVIRSLDFPEIAGVKNVRHYVLEMISDEPFTLTDIN